MKFSINSEIEVFKISLNKSKTIEGVKDKILLIQYIFIKSVKAKISSGE